MPKTATGPAEPRKGAERASKGSAEVAPGFIPTPERVSQFLERKTNEVMAQMTSVKGREQLFTELLKHEADLKKVDPKFNREEFRHQLNLVGETLSQKEKFLKTAQSPEKKGLFRRAWEKVKGFAKKHPVVTTLIVLALIAGGTGGAFYLTGNWELFLTKTGLAKIIGSAKAAKELIPPTPVTPELPGGGMLEVPPPISPPDLGIPT